MNRTYINLLCILIIVVLAASVIVPSIAMTAAFTYGFQEGLKDAGNPELEQTISNSSPISVVMPNYELPTPNDSIKFDNGHTLPAYHQTMIIYVPDNRYSVTAQIGVAGFGILCVIAAIIAAIQVVKFVIKINKRIIFDRSNIRHLSIMGICLLSIAIMQILSGLIKEGVVAVLGTSGGMSLTANWTIPWSNMLLGLLALLMAQIWRRGLQLKEEQELTI